MPFFSPIFTEQKIAESKFCAKCKKEFGELNYHTGDLISGEAVQCIRYNEFCIGCCP